MSDPETQQPNSVRLAILGCSETRSTFGQVYAAVDGIDVVALCDADLAYSRAWGKGIKANQMFVDEDDLYDEAEFDALVVAPAQLDPEATIQRALEAGKHVLFEIPAQIDLPNCTRLLEIQNSSGCFVMPAMPKRFDRTFDEAARIIHGRSLGPVGQIRCEWSWYTGWLERKPSLASWRNCFEDLAIQVIDVARTWLGEVCGVSGDIDFGDESQQGNRMANVVLQHEGGVSLIQVGSSGTKGVTELYSASGETGTLQISMTGSWSARSLEPMEAVIYRQDLPVEDVTCKMGPNLRLEAIQWHPYRRMLQRFADAIRFGGPLSPSLADYATAQEVIAAAILSTRDRTKVTLPLSPSSRLGEIIESAWTLDPR